MSNQIHIIQNAITTTISEIFRGDFRRICEVKKAVLHLEAIYFCHGTCYLLKRENMPIKDQLALYQRIELIPQSTTEFFENMRMNVTTFKRLWSSITGCSENSITW